MFNLDNFDLDFDDDFSSNIFGKGVNSEVKDGVESEGSRIFKESFQSPASEIQLKKENISNNFFDIPLTEKSRERVPNLKRCSSQDDKPHKKRLSNEGLLQRRFPGPAGLLPDKPFKEIRDLVLMDKPNDEDDMEKDKQIYSQSSGSVFLESPYQKLMLDFNLNEGNNPLNRYTVEWVKKTAINKGLQGRKIPFLAVVLHCVNHSTPDPVLLLRDPTGEINGTLHREVWADLGGKLQAGIALALRQVGVLITGVIRRQIYLNITINNILAVYRHSEEKNDVEMTTVNNVSKGELLRSLEGMNRQPPKPRQQPQAPTTLFTTVNDSRPNKEEINNLRNKLKNFVEGSKGTVSREPPNAGRRKTDEVLADLGLVLTDTDFNEEMKVPLGNSTPHEERKAGGTPVLAGTSSQVLSQAESLIFEEVLSGINLDEFEM